MDWDKVKKYINNQSVAEEKVNKNRSVDTIHISNILKVSKHIIEKELKTTIPKDEFSKILLKALDEVYNEGDGRKD